MAEKNETKRDGSPRAFTSGDESEGHHQSQSSARGEKMRAALGWVLTLLLATGWLLAAGKGAVRGTVADPSSAPIPGAKVTLVAADGSRQSVTSDQLGRYSFPSVEPATYTLIAEAAGFQAVTRTDVQVVDGTTTRVDLLLTATGPQQLKQAPPSQELPSYYDDTQLKASAVNTVIDAAGYSSQAQSPGSLLREGPSLSENALEARVHAKPENAAEETRLREALRANPDSFQTNHQLGKYYLSASRPKDGIPYLERAQQLNSEDASVEYDLAVAYLGAHHPAKAQALLRDLIRRKDSAELHRALGKADEALGDAASAVNEFQLAAKMDPSEENIFDWGEELLLDENVGPAIGVFKRGVARYPRSLRMYVGLGISLYSANSYDAAVEALCHASDLDPSDPRPYMYLGKMYNVSMGRAEEVAKRMVRFRETNPENALAYYYGALMAWKSSGAGERGVSLDQVESLLRKSLALDPGFADAHLQLGILFHDQHREQEALEEFQTAVRLNPGGPDAHYRLGQAYFRAGDRKRGQEELQLYDKLHKEQANEAEKRRQGFQRFPASQKDPGEANR
jgi:tetratricopeptide (TPR) repeat protein